MLLVWLQKVWLLVLLQLLQGKLRYGAVVGTAAVAAVAYAQ